MRSVQVETGQGVAEVLAHHAPDPSATLVLTHGAGGDVDTHDLAGLAEQLPTVGFSVLLVRMPWRVAGKKLAPQPAVIDACFGEVLEALEVGESLVVGGRSAGARSACRIAASYAASGVLALSFPLHPPGRPERSRVGELLNAGVPTLVVQGGRDPFGRPEEFPPQVARVTVPEADHAFAVPGRASVSREEALRTLATAVGDWLATLLPGR